MTYYVYILASQRNGTLYTGVTNNIEQRVFDHKKGTGSKFTHKYHVNQPMYYEETDDIGAAIHREKQVKKWKRQWKIALIEETNPGWNDLAKDWFDSL